VRVPVYYILSVDSEGELKVGFLGGLAAGLLVSRTRNGMAVMLTRGRLAFHHRLPRQLMDFLADAHRRGVLRQAGAVY
jgi:hypothetical protein